ncbi:MAG TPA: hypothetical protein VNY27_07800 [Solirubrobacteraceae bacterium]|jgi:hypothetical protein|nr:hypothetical protein [Solirubrobacteraceae bacterium]
MFFTAPHPTGTGSVVVDLNGAGAYAYDEACAHLVEDLRFEYLDRKEREAAAQTFAARAAVKKSESHIGWFMSEYAHKLLDLTCSFTVEHLIVDQRRELFGATFIPASDASLPTWIGGAPSPLDSVIAVPTRGTGGLRMMERGRESAEHALRLLRAGLREHRSIADDQLRFRIGTHYWFTVDGEPRAGWKRRPGEPITFRLNDELVELATSPPVAELQERGPNDIERRASRALAWWERSFSVTDPVIKIVFLFAALEAILGNRSKGIKSEDLAMHRAALSESLDERFSLPGRSLDLYEHVRSLAIHGEEPVAVSREEAQAFEWDIRSAINEYLRFARESDLTKRKQVRAELETKRLEIERWLHGDDHVAPEEPT